MNYVLYWILISSIVYEINSYLPEVKVKRGQLNESIEDFVSSSNISYIYYEYSNETFLRVNVSSQLPYGESILVIIKNENQIVSSINLSRKYKYSFASAERTICPHSNDRTLNQNRTLSLEVSTNSFQISRVSILVYVIDNFIIKEDETRNFTITENNPSYFQFELKELNSYTIHVNSSDNTCLILSIQIPKCPMYIYDNSIIELQSIAYQTITKQGAITIQKSRKNLNKIYVVFILSENDWPCSHRQQEIEKYHVFKEKFLSFSIQKDSTDYYWPIFGAIGFFLIFYFVSPIISFIYNRCFYKTLTAQVSINEGSLCTPLKNPLSYGSLSEHADMQTILSYRNVLATTDGESSSELVYPHAYLHENSYDSVSDAFSDPIIYRLNKNVKLSDFTIKNTLILKRKYFLYFWYLIIISVFYGLPVVQLVIKYQDNLEQTGNQDICFYNFLCTKPFYIFTAFNNVISNIGYVMLGILFTLLTWRREYLYQTENKHYGVPQYYGLFYAMGISLTMEGIMSACYHICPSSDNFQFDTAYMYILACLCMIKIYQTRHPDINATAHSFFMTMAFFIFIAVIGVVNVQSKIIFWVLFMIVYFFMCLFLTCEVYYMGCWKLNCSIFKRIYHMILMDKWHIFIPTYKRRMIVLFVFNVSNFGMALYGIIERPNNFPSYFLAIFMVNLLLYFVFYILMKVIHHERFHKISIAYVFIAVICWGFALYCFIEHPTDWQKTPSGSREENRNCILLDFYDIHDVWHFLSSVSMFFSFMTLQNIDDCLIKIERNKIAVF